MHQQTKQKKNLIADNVKGKIFVTGNTIVDAVQQNLALAKRKSKVITELGLASRKYLLLTLHREESVDFKENLNSVLNGIRALADTFNYEIIFPVHPRTIKRIKYFKLYSFVSETKKLRVINPLGYLDFLMLLASSKLVLTDSGGIQEESCILKVPCITLRKSTERPETVRVGANYIAGVRPDSMVKGVETMLNVKANWRSPFGKNASKKIIDIIENRIGNHETNYSKS